MIQLSFVSDWWDIVNCFKIAWVDFRFLELSISYENADHDLDIKFVILGLGFWLNIQW